MRTTIKLILIMLVFSFTNNAYSQIIRPTGTTASASQLVYYYDNSGPEIQSYIQVTNDNDVESVWIHVQIFRTFNPSPAVGDTVFCDERDFVDMLTPNDTHTYFINVANLFPKNIGETATTPGISTNIDATDSKGFVIITPVVSESDFSAISFQNLTGTTYFVDFVPGFIAGERYQIDAMGRDAVDFTTGEIVANGTPLDGETNGYVVIQPEELLFEFATEDPDNPAIVGESIGLDIVGVAFNDVYGPEGLLGYQVLAGDATWTPFVFDFKEDPTSCGVRNVNCFLTVGLNDSMFLGQNNQDLTESEDLLCSGTETPEYDPNVTTNFSRGFASFGWTRIFVSGLTDLENHIGFFVNANIDGGGLIYTKGEETEIAPPVAEEDCSIEGDEDLDGLADCLDPDCENAENCEGGDQCGDGEDNDGDGNSDCADGGCDGQTGPNGETCEVGGEVSCDDGFDNDADGLTDDADDDCSAGDDGGGSGGGGGGGCSIASTTQTSLFNLLLPLIVIGLVIGVRRKTTVN